MNSCRFNSNNKAPGSLQISQLFDSGLEPVAFPRQLQLQLLQPRPRNSHLTLCEEHLRSLKSDPLCLVQLESESKLKSRIKDGVEKEGRQARPAYLVWQRVLGDGETFSPSGKSTARRVDHRAGSAERRLRRREAMARAQRSRQVSRTESVPISKIRAHISSGNIAMLSPPPPPPPPTTRR